MLLLVTGGVILLILLVVYRSPLLPFLVLLVRRLRADRWPTAWSTCWPRTTCSRCPGSRQGILDVLVLGAGTDYALLLVSRFREELRRHESKYDAMRAAWRAALEPIVASGGTVILGLLCLLVSDLASNRGLGPVGAIGIACALLAMLTLLPAAAGAARPGRVLAVPARTSARRRPRSTASGPRWPALVGPPAPGRLDRHRCSCCSAWPSA